MARWEFKLPDIGEGVVEGEIVKWLVKPGDPITVDQPMVEVMTDKATVTIAAPRAGTILETRGKAGEIVAVHGVLVVFDLGGEPAARTEAPHANGGANGGTNGSHRRPDDGPAATAVGDIRESLPGMGVPAGRPAARGPSGATGLATYFNEKAFLHLEAPPVRVTGFDTPFPYTLELEYLPLAHRILPAIVETAQY